jgi:hypothetical protein
MITLASDFGSPYPAAMRGVICSRSDARLVDVTHELPRQDVRAAAFWTRELLPWFPPAVHLVVVDPGVGTDRAALVLTAGDHVLVGPDNGVLDPVARELADGRAIGAYRIDDADARSSTFHGRDVFAPAAADVHERGVEGVDRIDPVDSYREFSLPTPTVDADAGRAVGEVLVVDGFGNAITNLPGSVLDGRESVRVAAGGAAGDRVPVGETFASVEPGERVATVGSHGDVELDVNRGRGDEAFGIEPGDEVVLEWPAGE